MADQPAAPAAGSSPSQQAPGDTPAPAHPPQAELIPAVLPEGEEENDEADSALGAEDAVSSTASVASSILNYRTIQGRTFHSEKYNTEYFTPNDEQQSESVDITHHYLTVLLGGKLFLAPIKKDVEKVLDVGTGTGIWAIDFADEFENTQVIGTDLSPIQPTWVPPNLKFELDDALQTWSWPEGEFDFVHLRYLFGAIADWGALFKEAFRVCKPGGWVESCEVDPVFLSDDGTTDKEWGIKMWNSLYREGGKKFGRSFCVVEEDLQMPAFKEAGFVDIQHVDYKVPLGGWAQDARLKEVGEFVKLTIENDIEGYTLFMWNNILGWSKDEYQIFLMSMRKCLKNKSIHGWMNLRFVYGRKPEAGEVPTS